MIIRRSRPRTLAPDEPIRHKLLDAWGDLALAGPIRARWVVERGSHRLHVRALRAALRGLQGGG